MLITRATLANWQSSIHCSLCGCVSSKSRACVSPLVSGCGTRRGESLLTLFYSPQLTSDHFFFFFMLTDRVVGHSSVVVLLLEVGAVARWQGPIRTLSIIMSAFTGSWACGTKRGLFALTTKLTPLAPCLQPLSVNLDNHTTKLKL